MTARMPSCESLPRRLALSLVRARDAELVATGPDRRVAFRLTRALIGGARRAGYPVAALAECLGVSAAAIQDRGGSDGWVTDVQLSRVCGVRRDAARRWHRQGLLVEHHIDAGGHDCYRASEIIRMLIHSAHHEA